MVETLFGSGQQLWPALPLSAVPSVYFQGPRGSVPSAPTTFTPQFPGGAGAQPVMVNGPTLTAPDMYGGVTAQALLAFVAARRGQPTAPGTDADIEDFISDALDLLPGATEIEVRCEDGRVTLTGAVPNKRVKRDAGEIVWALPALNDVQNNITIAARRRSRSGRRETEATAVPTPSRKSA
jgi:hypothetical protein